MLCGVICRKCMNSLIEIQYQIINVLMKRLKQSSQFIIRLFSFCLNIEAKQLVVDVEDNVVWNFKAFEVNSKFRFSKCLNRLDFVVVCSPDCPELSGWRLHWLHTAALVPACLVRSVFSTLQWFHIVGLRSSRPTQVSSVSRCDSSNQKV